MDNLGKTESILSSNGPESDGWEMPRRRQKCLEAETREEEVIACEDRQRKLGESPPVVRSQ